MSKLLGILALLGTITWTVPKLNPDASSDVPGGVLECELAEEWVATNLDKLPITLNAFSEHSITFRRAIFRELDAKVRTSLWREHLAAVAHDVTSAEQRLFLERVSGELDGLLSGTEPPSELDILVQQARAILGEDLARRAMGVLGPEPEPVAAVAEDGTVAPQVLCSCSTASDFCPTPARCSAGACVPRARGCGWFWLYGCDGLCWGSP